MLSMATVTATQHNPTIRAHYQRLRAAGKRHQIANVVCMRELLTTLNPMVRKNQTWQLAST